MNKFVFVLVLSLISLQIDAHRILRSLPQLLPKNPVILEAGAYDGEYTLQMSELWPSATIYSFEPVPLLFLKTKAKTFNRKNVRCFQLALSSQTGNAPFYVSSDPENEISRSGSLLEPKNHLTLYPTVKFNKRIDVATINLDEWATLNNVDHIDLMWLDMQGAEFSMLKAAPQMVATAKAIFIKIAFTQTYKDIPLYAEVRTWLEQNSFKVIFEEVCGDAKAEGYALFIKTQ